MQLAGEAAHNVPYVVVSPTCGKEPLPSLYLFRACATSIATASAPTVKTILANRARLTPEAGQIPFQAVIVEYAGQRPATRNFGRLVHTLLETGDTTAMEHIPALLGRRIGHTEREITSAVALARATLRHPPLNPA